LAERKKEIAIAWGKATSVTHFNRIKMSSTGEKPGRGAYTCTTCGQVVVLDDTSDTLPPCPKCHGTDYRP
jgi:Zn finger protein HypA/HybF involved in hydrogenase expression